MSTVIGRVCKTILCKRQRYQNRSEVEISLRTVMDEFQLACKLILTYVECEQTHGPSEQQHCHNTRHHLAESPRLTSPSPTPQSLNRRKRISATLITVDSRELSTSKLFGPVDTFLKLPVF